MEYFFLHLLMLATSWSFESFLALSIAAALAVAKTLLISNIVILVDIFNEDGLVNVKWRAFYCLGRQNKSH